MEEPEIEKIESESTEILPTDFFFFRGELRTIWRILIFGALYIVLAFLLLVPIQFIPPLRSLLGTYFVVQHGVTLLATFLVLRFIDRKPFGSVGLELTFRGLRQFGKGTAVAVSAISVVALLLAGGQYIDFRMGPGGVEDVVRNMGSGLLLYAVVGFGEELLVRGYCFQALMRGTNRGIAVVSSSVVFGLLHAWNPGVTIFALVNITLAGVWFALAYIVTRQLWFPIGLHFGWNFTLGTVYGFPVSGIQPRSILRVVDQGGDWITGGAFGPEGGIVATAILLAGITLMASPRFQRFCETQDQL